MKEKCPHCRIDLSVDTGEVYLFLNGKSKFFTLFCHECGFEKPFFPDLQEGNNWPISYEYIELIKKIENPMAECPNCFDELTEGHSDIIPGIFVDCVVCGFSAYSNDDEKSFWLYKIIDGKKNEMS